MSGPGTSKRARLLRAVTDGAARQAAGIQHGLVEGVPCYGQRGGGCRKRLAEILYGPDGEIALVVRAPYTLDAGVVVLERAGKITYPASVVPIADGVAPAFRCPRCHKTTTVHMAELAARAPGEL